MVTVFGSINIDLVAQVEAFPRPGETIAGTSLAMFPGGKGANQALACVRAGAATVLVGAVGRDAFSAPALSMLEAAGVDLSYVGRVDGATGCAMILVARDGQNTIVSVPGANASADADSVPDTVLARSSTVSLQQEIPISANLSLIRRAKRKECRIVLNASPSRALSIDTLRAIDCLIVNDIEAASLASSFGWPASPEELARAASAAADNLTIVVTLGVLGALAVRGGTLLYVRAPNVRVADTTGAGDAFAGTFIATLDSKSTLDEALRRAVAAGSLACTVAGAQPSFPERPAVDAILDRIEPTVSQIA